MVRSVTGNGAGCLTHDGGSRSARLKYDTPAIGPLSISVSVGNNEYWDGMAKIAGSFGDSGYDLRVGYIGETDVAATECHRSARRGADAGYSITRLLLVKPAKTAGDTIGGSAAVKFPQGTSIAASWGQSDAANTESQHIELDHSYGDGSIGIAYRQGRAKWRRRLDLEPSASVTVSGMAHTAYAGYRFIEGDDEQDRCQRLLFAGMRVTFN